MEHLGFRTDKISWTLLFSAISRIQTLESRKPSVNLNFEATTALILSAISIEAFINEVSSIANCVLEDEDLNYFKKSMSNKTKLENVAEIKDAKDGSFYDRYKNLLRTFNIDNPKSLEHLFVLKNARNTLVHFHECDVPIITDPDGIIRDGQDIPTKIIKLKAYSYKGSPLLSNDDGAPWTLRMATDSMAVWSIDQALNAITYVLENISDNGFKKIILKNYKARDQQFPTVFHLGKRQLENWWDQSVK